MAFHYMQIKRLNTLQEVRQISAVAVFHHQVDVVRSFLQTYNKHVKINVLLSVRFVLIILIKSYVVKIMFLPQDSYFVFALLFWRHLLLH